MLPEQPWLHRKEDGAITVFIKEAIGGGRYLSFPRIHEHQQLSSAPTNISSLHAESPALAAREGTSLRADSQQALFKLSIWLGLLHTASPDHVGTILTLSALQTSSQGFTTGAANMLGHSLGMGFCYAVLTPLIAGAKTASGFACTIRARAPLGPS